MILHAWHSRIYVPKIIIFPEHGELEIQTCHHELLFSITSSYLGRPETTSKMSAVAVENPTGVIAPHKKQAPFNSIPNIDSLEGVGNDDSDEYSTLKKLQRHLE